MRRVIEPFMTVLISAGTCAGGVQLEVVAHTPERNSIGAPASTPIEIVFDRPVDAASLSASPFVFHAFGERTGPISGSISVLDGGVRARLTPDAPLIAGERVWVTVSHDAHGVDGSPLRDAGYAWQFWAAAAPATLEFSASGTLDTTEPGVSPRPYGGQACDLNADRLIDLCIINEDTSDLRVFLNSPGAPGTFAPFMQPTSETGPVPSPNEAADFNGDGHADICTANTAGNTVSVLLGNGDGTFQPRTDYVCGAEPRGVAVLDVDGDGDIDIATANTGAGNIGILRNDGSGAFGALTTFDGGGNGEWALNAADMNNDGVTDLVVGAQYTGRISVHLSNGDGTFAPSDALNTGLPYWMIVCADINADGHMDVTAAASSAGAAVHLGDGAGHLGPANVFPVGGMVATDTGDLDGDADLDWVLSSFFGGEWYLLENINGTLTHTQTFPAGSNPACALVLDFDDDGALDLAFIDEISDLIYLHRNTPAAPACPGDVNNSGGVDIDDLNGVLAPFGTNVGKGHPADVANSDGLVDIDDLNVVLANWGAACS